MIVKRPDEAALFAGDLFRMYQRYAAEHGWRVEVGSVSEGDAGGYKEIIASIAGEGVFGRLKFESGVHRVQRAPDTETQGRIHTSAATVAVLPEVEDNLPKVIEGEALDLVVLRFIREAPQVAGQQGADRRGRAPTTSRRAGSPTTGST